MTVAPLIATLWPDRAAVLPPVLTNMLNAAAAGTEFSSSSSSKVMTSVFSFTVALTKPGAVVSAGVSLVTVLGEKPGTSAIALSASLSRFVPGV